MVMRVFRTWQKCLGKTMDNDLKYIVPYKKYMLAYHEKKLKCIS